VTGSAQPKLNQKNLNSIQIPLPPLPEQTRIVSKLDALFARIDKSIALLEENIKHTKGLMASVLEEVFHSSVKQISLSEIIVKTANINPLLEPETKFTYIDITSVNSQLHQIENPKIIQGKDAPSRAKKSVIVGDIVFATTRPNLKNIAIVNEDYPNPVASTGFCVLRTKKGINNEFLFLCLLSNNIQEQINPFIRGAQYPAISDKDLLKCKIPDLSIVQQIETANKIMMLRKKLSLINATQQSKLTSLKALKSSLLDRAFKGELTKSELPTRRDKL
jgi:type I restriction enzyme S subunit